jgi:hypothetical protein
MTKINLREKMLTNISTDSANDSIGHLEDLDQQVTVVTFPGTTQLEIGLEFRAT